MSVKVMGITAGRKDSNSEILLKEALLRLPVAPTDNQRYDATQENDRKI